MYASNFVRMYSKQEAAKLRQEFWTAFGQYMSPVLSAEGEKINWINYKTGIKDVHFKMDADGEGATVRIVLQHSDPLLQQLYFDQFMALKKLFHQQVGEEWNWNLHGTNEFGKTVSSISKTLHPASIFDKEDWPRLISFFKPRMIALDEFWSSAQYSFQSLG